MGKCQLTTVHSLVSNHSDIEWGTIQLGKLRIFISSVVILFCEICDCRFCSCCVLSSRSWRTRHLFLIVAVNANRHSHLDLWMRAVLALCFLLEG